MVNELRPYQTEVFNAVARSVAWRKGMTFTVEIARQGGKNELSAQLELSALAAQYSFARDLIKCSPTFIPQALISMTRLKQRLDSSGFARRWTSERGFIIRVGRARAVFLSADESSRVVGHTAHLLLEVDEAQDIDKEKYSKEFKPMAATTNATTVLYGTAWDDSSLLEETKQVNLELQRKDRIKRHFSYDWQEVARYNPDYLKYVESERQRLGEDHPLFRTQYRLLPVRAGGGFLSAAQRAQMQGDHPRLHAPQPGRVYVAGIDLAGEAEELEGHAMTSVKPRRDSTVVTIAELDLSSATTASAALCPASLDPSGLATGSVGARCVSPAALSPASIDLPRPPAGPVGARCVSPATLSPTSLDPSGPPAGPVGARHAVPSPSLRIVEHYAWTGIRHVELYPRLVDLLKSVWRCRRVVIDATGVGQPVSSFLRQAIGTVVSPFDFTAPSKSELGFNLLAAVNSGRLKVYALDGSAESQNFWIEMEKARSFYRPSQTLSFYVDPSDGHDDFLMSLALVVEAANQYEPRTAKGRQGLLSCERREGIGKPLATSGLTADR